jgi:DGQHR domain-containing protein
MLTLTAISSPNLDTVCLRGTAALADLARISRADVFDQELNPNGLQRDFSMKHAAEAYEYVSREPDERLPRAFPEIVLNVRDKNVVSVTEAGQCDGLEVVQVAFDEDAIMKSRGVKVSRVDGNHRLLFANGDDRDRKPVDVLVPFQLHIGLTKDEEKSLFVDLNANHKGLNTSHLATLRSNLTRDEVELIQRPALVYAKRLAIDEASPFNHKVFMGGSRAGSKKKGIKHPVTLVGLEGAVRRLMTKSQYLQELLADPESRYGVVRNYWLAVAATWPEAFEQPSDYLIMKSIGVNSLAQLGGQVVDRCMMAGDPSVQQMMRLLEPTKDVFDWHKDAPADRGVGGMSGNRAVLLIAGELAKALPPLPTREPVPA